MSTLRFLVQGTGGPAGNMVSRLHFAGPNDATGRQAIADGWRDALFAIRSFMPSGVTWTFTGVADEFDSDGTLIGSYTYTPPTQIVGSGTGAWAAGVGAVVGLVTAGIVAGRRVRGRHFVVPLVGSAYDSDGTIATAALTGLRTYGEAIRALGSGNLLVTAGFGTPGGSAHVVTNTVVNDKVAILRSRRS